MANFRFLRSHFFLTHPVLIYIYLSAMVQDREGVVCPWHTAFDGLVWEYRAEGDTWQVDDSVTVQCVAFT